MSRVVPLLFLIVLAAPPAPAGAAGHHPPEALGVQAPGARVEAPDFALPSLRGDTLRLRDLRGRVVLLNFWATWCLPCRTEMPEMERLSRDFGEKGLVVVAIDLQEGRRAVQGFVDELKLTFPVVLDGDGTVAAAYGVRPIPVTFLIDRDGFILWRALGPRRWAGKEARAYFSRILGSPPTLAGRSEAR